MGLILENKLSAKERDRKRERRQDRRRSDFRMFRFGVRIDVTRKIGLLIFI